MDDRKMTSKIRIKCGSLEIEYEGEEGYLKDELPKLVEKILEVSTTMGSNLPDEASSSAQKNPRNESDIEITTSNIATKIGAKSGSDVATAACLHLALVQRKDTFSRQEMLEEMKTATAAYNENMAKNLSPILGALLKKEILNEPRTGIFALTDSARSTYLAKLKGG